MAADIIDFSSAKMSRAVCVSGGFDPVHSGHIDLFENASQLGPVLVILNSDDWLIRKKGFFHQTWDDRKRILEKLPEVNAVVPVDDSDGTVCEALRRLRPGYFANGGDRTDDNVPELELCGKLGIEPVFGLGGKVNSSSAIIKRSKVQRNWGSYEVLAESPWCKVKRLVVNPDSATSKQRHALREEYWFTKDGGAQLVERGKWHRLSNPSNLYPMEVIEVQLGDCREEDIERA